jgi:tetratricopeptide (TPR) repeat protein
MQEPNPSTPQARRAPPFAPAPVVVVAIFAATFAAYLPALHGGLLWDDAAHITARGLRGWDGLWRIWFRLGSTQQYYPVLHSAFWLEHRLWGDSVLGYHVLNVGLHATAACLFALALARVRPGTDGRRAPAGAEWLAAAIFALHPVCVESVAWISEQKNTLSLVLYLLSALAYLRFDRERGWGWYSLALGLFALAILSKSVTATLPGALLLLLAWRRGGLSWRRDVLPLAPWLVVGVGAGLFTAWVEQTYIGAHGGAFDLGPLRRCLLAGRIVWFYLGKLVWPTGLAFIYERWNVVADWRWSLGFVGVAAALAALSGTRRLGRGPLVAMLFFLGSALPALGFFNVYPFLFSYVADHWQYLPCLGVIALAAEGSAAVALRASRRLGGTAGRAAGLASAGAAAALLAVLFLLTHRQCALYRDVGTLYEDTLAKDPGCWMAHNNLGVYLMEKGSLDASLSHLEQAVRLKPDYSDAHNNLGNALAKVPGRSAEAIAEFRTAIRLEPGMTQAHANLGLALVDTPGGLPEGIAELRRALAGNSENPDYAGLHAGLGRALARVPGGLPGAISEFETALRLDPGAVDTRNALGVALDRAGRLPEAAGQFERVLRDRPESAEAHDNLGNVLAQLGRGPEAVEQYRAALRLKPDFPEAHFNLGRALRSVGDGEEAVSEYRQALRLAPGSAEIRSSLGSALYRQGRILEAVGEYQEAVRLQPEAAAYRNNLGLALAGAGRLDEAIDQLSKAVELEPGFKDAHYNLAMALLRAHREADAAAEFSKSGRPGP